MVNRPSQYNLLKANINNIKMFKTALESKGWKIKNGRFKTSRLYGNYEIYKRGTHLNILFKSINRIYDFISISDKHIKDHYDAFIFYFDIKDEYVIIPIKDVDSKNFYHDKKSEKKSVTINSIPQYHKNNWVLLDSILISKNPNLLYEGEDIIDFRLSNRLSNCLNPIINNGWTIESPKDPYWIRTPNVFTIRKGNITRNIFAGYYLSPSDLNEHIFYDRYDIINNDNISHCVYYDNNKNLFIVNKQDYVKSEQEPNEFITHSIGKHINNFEELEKDTEVETKEVTESNIRVEVDDSASILPSIATKTTQGHTHAYKININTEVDIDLNITEESTVIKNGSRVIKINNQEIHVS